MAEFDAQVEGITELTRILKELSGDKIAKKSLRAAIRKGAKPILQAARAFAPVDSGALEESIKLKAIRRTRTGFGVRISTSASDNEYSGETFYGPMQEFGTAKMAPNPYLRPAFDTTKDEATRIVGDELLTAILSGAK